METFYPLRFNPVYKDYPWGGSRIPKRYNRKQAKGVIAESWEISTHPDGLTEIANGPLTGKTLADLLPKHKTVLLGTNVLGNDFPLLIKLIDARDTLSIQVHPNETNAAAVNGEPKTEMWYFLADDKSAQVYCGFKPGVDREIFLQAMENKTLSKILRTIPAKIGEAVFVPAGCVHAIDKGCLILEIQQNSNTTYRIDDWGRTTNGMARELHLNQALQVIDWGNNKNPRCTPSPFEEAGVQGLEIKRSSYFRLDRFELTTEQPISMSGESFHAVFIPEGTGSISWSGGEEILTSGQSWLIPAALGDYTIRPENALMLLRVTIPI